MGYAAGKGKGRAACFSACTGAGLGHGYTVAQSVFLPPAQFLPRKMVEAPVRRRAFLRVPCCLLPSTACVHHETTATPRVRPHISRDSVLLLFRLTRTYGTKRLFRASKSPCTGSEEAVSEACSHGAFQGSQQLV